jgi:hypothetical protein
MYTIYTGTMHATRAHHASIRSRTCSRDTQTQSETRQIHMANICGCRGPRASRARRSACSAAAPTQNTALRRDTPPARAASAKQRAPPEINHAQHLHACRECLAVARGAGDARSQPAMPEHLVKASHQTMDASSIRTSAKTRAREKIDHAQSTMTYRSRMEAARGAGDAKRACTRTVRVCRSDAHNGNFACNSSKYV